MANPIKTSDLIQNTGDIKKLRDELSHLSEEIKRLLAIRDQLMNQQKQEIKNAKKLQNQNEKLKVSTVQQREEIEKNSKQANEIARRYQKYTESLNDNGVKIAALKNAQRQLNQVNKLEAKLLSEKEGSYNRLSAQYSLNKIRLNQMSKAEREGTKAGKDLVKQSADLYEEMKRLQEETGKHTLNVGNYRDAIKDLPGPLGQAQSALDDLGDGMRALLRNPLLLFLTAIVGALAALFKAFQRSEKGAELLARGAGILEGVMSALTGLSVQVAEGLTSAFENPMQTLKDFGQLLVNQILNRIKSIPLIAQAAGRALKAVFRGDFEEVKEAGEDAFFAINQAITGLDEQTQRDVAAAFVDLKEKVEETADAFGDLRVRQRSIRRANRALTRTIEELTTAQELNSAAASDGTLSFEEQRKAAIAAREAIEEKAAAELKLARNNLSLINAEIDLRRENKEEVEGLLDQQLEAYREVIAAERGLTLAIRDNEQTRRQIKQDELERTLDFLIDGFDNQKTNNEKRLQDERMSLEQRREILAETAQLADDSFKKQIETIQQFTAIQIDANELINESDLAVLDQKVRSLGVSDIIAGRILEIIRDRKSANQDLNEAEKDLDDEARERREKNLAQMKQYNQERKEKELEVFDQKQELQRVEFERLKKTEAEKTAFQLAQERERLEKILELNKRYNQERKEKELEVSDQKQELQLGGDLNELQLSTIRAQIAALNEEINKITNVGPQSIWEALKIKPDEQEAIKSSFDFAKQQVQDLINTNARLAQQNLERADQRVETAEEALQTELALAEQGYSANVELRRQELADERKRQQEAIRDQKKAQRAQQAVQAAQQAGNLITASSKIFSQVGNPFLAIPLIALMWGTFAAAKIRAAQLTKKQFGEGGLELLGGGSHASGNDTYLGFQSEGKPAYGERGEAVAIIPRRSTQKYMSDGTLQRVVDSLRRGTFENEFQLRSDGPQGAFNIVYTGGHKTDMSETNSYLKSISKNTERQYQTGPDGVLIERYKNVTRIYGK